MSNRNNDRNNGRYNDRYNDRARSRDRNEQSYGGPPRGVRDNGYGNAGSSNGNGGTSKWAQAASAVETGRTNRYDGWENVHEEDENYDDEGYLARRTRAVQNDSAETTRRALQKAREAEDLAGRSLNQLNQQSEQLHKIEHRLDMADGHAKISEAKATELKALNRWFFVPTFGASKKSKAAEDKFRAEMQEQEERDRMRRENVRNGGGYYTGSANDVGRYDDGGRRGGGGAYRDDGASRRGGNNSSRGNGGGYGKSYSTPDGLDRDELEEEIDGNLDEISDALHRLKMMGTTMGQEIDSQTTHIRQINDKTDMVRDRVDKVNRDISKIAGGGRKKK
ncbi:hypothetical protein HDU82_005111 [Entophlyctis luteolus]|nr:hypothetical protein HDU82_005111 [Entophlyctis luteolus]KAJ3395296.1 hypothetical protein HDU84_000063 [Entophlyctis sp. JEL0112]